MHVVHADAMCRWWCILSASGACCVCVQVVVYTGLMELLGSEEELAAVLAHETGHVLARHHVSPCKQGQENFFNLTFIHETGRVLTHHRLSCCRLATPVQLCNLPPSLTLGATRYLLLM